MPLKYPQVIDLSQELSQGFAARFIGYKASRLVGRVGFKPSDREDIEQELKLHLVQRFEKFDPRAGHWNAFVMTVVSRYIFTLIVKRRRLKRRDDLESISLEKCIGNNSNTACGADHVTPAAADATVQVDRTIDVQEAINRLPHRSRDLCRRLMTDSPAEVARQLGIPRTTLASRISALRQHFVTAAEESKKILRRFENKRGNS